MLPDPRKKNILVVWECDGVVLLMSGGRCAVVVCVCFAVVGWCWGVGLAELMCFLAKAGSGSKGRRGGKNKRPNKGTARGGTLVWEGGKKRVGQLWIIKSLVGTGTVPVGVEQIIDGGTGCGTRDVAS